MGTVILRDSTAQQLVTQPRNSSASQASSSWIPSALGMGVQRVKGEDGGAELWEATWGHSQ